MEKEEKKMGYGFESRVRYSETGEDGCLTLVGILNYFQDCCTFQSESIGQGFQAVKERGHAWVLSAWQVIVNKYPFLGEEIITCTAPYDFRGFMGMRNFTLDTRDGERLACANTFWTNINIHTGLPEKLTEEDVAGYKLEPKLDMAYAPRKITLPTQWEKKESFIVQKHHLDTNHHVNNCQYVCMAQDFLPDDFLVGQMRAEYKKQARFGDRVCPQVYDDGQKVVVSLNETEGQPYAIVEFLRK